MEESQKSWSVYKHTSPSGKVYIGITHLTPTVRWGKEGNHYSKKTIFYKAIQKYGWENFSHEILFHNCSEQLAKALEIAFIRFYKEKNLSYNMTIGGEGHNLGVNSSSSEYRTLVSRLYRKNHPDYDKEQYEKHKEHKKAAARNYYQNNREKVLNHKKSSLEIKEKTRLRAAEWRRKHPDYMKEYMKKYNQKIKSTNE